MKNIYLILGSILIISACGGDPQESEFVSSCVSGTPGGDSYVEICQCAWDQTLKSMNNNEIAAMRRDWNEIGDMQYSMDFVSKSMQAGLSCAENAIN